MPRKRLTHEEFVRRGSAIHNGRYTYQEPYIHSQVKLTIVCPDHGGFKQEPTSHLNGQGCPHCKGALRVAKSLGVSLVELPKNGQRYCKVHGVQDLEKFYVNEWRGETKYQCRECLLSRIKSSPKYNSEATKEKVRELTRGYRWEVIEYYSKGTLSCACCGEARYEFLCLDHINGGGTKHRKEQESKGGYWRSFKKKGWPDGFRVLCHNCNMSIGAWGHCPHELERLSKSQVPDLDELLQASGLNWLEEGVLVRRRHTRKAKLPRL